MLLCAGTTAGVTPVSFSAAAVVGPIAPTRTLPFSASMRRAFSPIASATAKRCRA